MNGRHDGLQEIIDDALEEMAAEAGEGFDPQTCNLAGFCRRTGLARSRARTLRGHGFRVLPHGNSGRRATETVLSGYTGIVDSQLRLGVTNSQVIFERLLGQGYEGGLTTVFDSLGVAGLSIERFRVRARKTFGYEHGHVDHPRPARQCRCFGLRR